MLGHQSLAQLQGLAIGFFRLVCSTGGFAATRPGCCAWWPVPGGTRAPGDARPPDARAVAGPGDRLFPPRPARPVSCSNTPRLLCVLGQFLAVLGHLGMLGHQLLIQLQGWAKGFFRLVRSTGGSQQHAQVGVRPGQFLAVLGHLGMLGHQLLAKLQGPPMAFSAARACREGPKHDPGEKYARAWRSCSVCPKPDSRAYSS
jgi:hypothetical protein